MSAYFYVGLLLLLSVVSGCASLGPSSISMGRADYNEAINRTEDEQMLLSIVKGRYGDSYSLLAVSGVAANVKFRTNAAVEAGFGPESYFLGNLVPFSGGLAYEENPTITYTPVLGERYLRQLLSPLPLDLLVLIVRSGTNPAATFALLINRINDLQNPDFLTGPNAVTDASFERFVRINDDLEKAGVLHFVEDPRDDIPFDILITGYNQSHLEKVKEYLELLGLQMPLKHPRDIILPVSLAVKVQGTNGVAISTRSTFDLIEILRASIEIPQEHSDAGVAIKYSKLGMAGKNLRIHSSKEKPEQAAFAVKHRGYWFYILDSDMRTKMYYLMIRTLWSVCIATVSDQNSAPLLTIPVSR